MGTHNECRQLQLIAAGLGFGQQIRGVELGPSAWIRFFMQHFPELLKQAPVTELVCEKFQYQPIRNVIEQERFPWRLYSELTEQIEIAQSYELLPVTLGGDHSLGLASVQASLNHFDNLKLLWIDAHADINTPLSSPTGSVHGMPLAHLLGLWRDSDRQLLKPQNLLILGVRDLDQGEKEIIDELNIKVISMKDIKEHSMLKCIRFAMDFLEVDRSPVHVSFDVDSLDPSLFPATGVPVSGGISLSQAEVMFSEILRIPYICAFDLVEFNPLICPSESYRGQLLLGQFLSSLQKRLNYMIPQVQRYPYAYTDAVFEG